MLVQGTSPDKRKENVTFQVEGFDDEQIVMPESDCVNSVADGELEVTQANSIGVSDLMVDENRPVDCTVQPVGEQENLDSFLEVHTYDPGPMGQMKVDTEFSIDDFCEVLDSCYGRHTVVEPSTLGQDIKESKEFKHPVQLKDMELEKPEATLGAAGFSCPLTAVEEIEEGEICGEAGVSVESMDALPNDTESFEVIAAEVIHASEDKADKKESFCNIEHGGLSRHETCGPSLICILDNDNSFMKVETRASPRKMLDNQPQRVFANSYLVTNPATDTPLLSGRSPQRNATEDPISAIIEEDCDDSKKKRKNGPLSKERRAKKKLKSRLKRAEKNRQLGIKRLKLQPVLKPKNITYCRHYLQGRCHEGEKCKFSHDTTPLTKSKPCGHFARHSCMKGDECPYDHQLSKYPCNNYTSTGFCSRGSDCLFSHEIMSTTSNVLKPDLKPALFTTPDKEDMLSKVGEAEVMSFCQLNNLNSSKPADILTSQQKLDAKFSNVRDSYGKSLTKNVAKPFARTVSKAPKGVSFLSDPSMSLVHNSKLEPDGAFQKAGDGADIGDKAIRKMPDSVIKVNEGVASRKPRGINFLSFVQPSLDDSSGKTFSNLFLNSSKQTGKSVMADLAEEKQAPPLPKNGSSSLVNCGTNQTPISWTPSLNQEGKNTPGTLLPQHMKSPSLPKIQSNASIFKDDVFSSRAVEKPTAPGKLPPKMPLISSGGGSWDQPTSVGPERKVTSSVKASLLLNTPILVQKAVQSALAFAAKFEPEIKPSSSFTNGKA